MANERLTSTRLRQIISGGDEDEDSEQDLRQYNEQQDTVEDDASNAAFDDLEGADLEIQEALLVEDLLSVLAVSTLHHTSKCTHTHLAFQAVPGQFITPDPDYPPEDEIERLQGARWVVSDQIGESPDDL
jgi:hypothetical protein